mgnify:CR=1 FL=1
MTRFHALTLTLLIIAFICTWQTANARRYNGYRVGPRIIENIPVAPPPGHVLPPQHQPPPPGESAQPSPIAIDNAQPRAEDPSPMDTALEALNDMAQPKTTPREQANYIGNWVANVGPAVRVQLNLQKNGTFAWQASSGDRANGFRGTYVIDQNVLTLTRTDGKSLSLNLSPNEGGFNLKSERTRDAGLDFFAAE